jgi:tetratricopeptide (TPR) repeat protein
VVAGLSVWSFVLLMTLAAGCRRGEQTSTSGASQEAPLASSSHDAAGKTASPPTTGSGPTASASVSADLPFAVLAPEDRDFVDKRGGWGWSDRCFLHMKARRLPSARAACDKAREMNPASPQPRASILYNFGMVEELRGNKEAARSYYTQSLAVRPSDSVQDALKGLDAPADQSDPEANDPFARALAHCEKARDRVLASRAAIESAKQSMDVEGIKQAIEQLQQRMPAWQKAADEAKKQLLQGGSGAEIVSRNQRFQQTCALQ